MPLWLPFSSLAVVVSRMVILSNDDLLLYIGTIGLLLVLFIMGIVLFKLLYIRKHFDRAGNIINAPQMFPE